MARNHAGRSRSVTRLTVLTAFALAGALTLADAAAAEKRLDVRALERGYVEALDLLARGNRQDALDKLMTIEVAALGTTPSVSRLERVWRQKLSVVRKALELTTPEVLVPVIMLHHDAYELYREARQPILARHARDMAADLATYKAQTTKKDADREFAGWVLTSFGASNLTLHTSGSSASMLRDALALSPGNPVALMGLAWAHEAHGEYEEASALLAKLLEFEPGHTHARVRLAVCQRRMGELEQAKRNFERALTQESVDWVRSIARQELARTLITLEDLQGAEEQMRAALEETPGNQEAALLLASILERQGRQAAADEVIAVVEPTGSSAPSARYIYDGRPELEIERARDTLRALVDERLDLLASGLRWWGAGGAEIAAQGGEEGR